jgi:uroporphyrinogen-III synthase
MRVLVTRPAKDGAQTAAQLAALGHQAVLAPLLTTHFFDLPAPTLDDVQAILATSANGVRAFARLSPRRDLALFAVGPQTAEAAAAAGFENVRNADGDARALAGATARWTSPAKGTLLHVSGEQGSGVLADTLATEGFTLRKAVLYRVEAADTLPAAAATALANHEVEAALFFSPRSARVFAQLAARDNLSVHRMIAVCISDATAAALTGAESPPDFAGIRIAARPNQDALLARLAG